MGELSKINGFYLPIDKTKDLCLGKIELGSIVDSDLKIQVTQKGVDMRIGLDIASLCYKKLVNQIVLISGDSDFVPAAKLARKEGVDFILDPLGAKIDKKLYGHVDGLNTKGMTEILEELNRK